MEGFRDWLVAQGLTFPVDENLFISRLQEFTADSSSLLYRSLTSFGFVDGELRYASFDAITELEFSTPASAKDPEIAFWNAYVEELNISASKGG